MTPSPKSDKKQKAKLQFDAIGTKWEIDLVAPADELQDISSQITSLILDFDKTYSRFRPDSWIIKAGREIGAHKTPETFEKIFEFYKQMYELTNGLVTPVIGELMEGAGYDANYSLKPGRLERPRPIDEILDYNDNTLHVKYYNILDFGAAGKGFLVDLVSDLLLQLKIVDFLIDAGGDILDHSPAPTPVGLENPENFKEVIGKVQLFNKSLAASAGNRRKWANFNHIINPKTLKSVTSVSAVWVITDSCMVADGLATCLFFVPPEKLVESFSFEYLVLKQDNSYVASENFPGEVFNVRIPVAENR